MTSQELRQKILEENARVHRIESSHYEALHSEIFNFYEQRTLKKDITWIVASVTKSPPNKESCEVLDIGCGTGNLLLKFLALDLTATGLDLSQEMLDICQRKVDAAFSPNKKCRLIHSDIDSFIAQNKQTFDIVSMSSVLHHLPDYKKTITRLLEVIRPGGFLYIAHEPLKATERKNTRISDFLDQIDQSYFKARKRSLSIKVKIDYSYSDYHAIKGCDLHQIVAIIEDKGFETKKLKKCSANKKLGTLSLLDNWFKLKTDSFKLICQKSS